MRNPSRNVGTVGAITRATNHKLVVGILCVILACLAATGCELVSGVTDLHLAQESPDSAFVDDATVGGGDAAEAGQDAETVPDDGPEGDATDGGSLPPEDAGPDCGAGNTYCGIGGCRNLDDDPRACGECANDCTVRFGGTHVDPASIACHQGACTYACAAGFADCGDAGVDAGADGGSACATDLSLATTCGTCGASCGTGFLCAPEGDAAARQFACASSCPAGAPTICEGACINETTNNTPNATNCGGCGHAHDCSGGEVCQAAACTCVAGETLCPSGCTNIHGSDVNNCGACGNVCKGPTTGSGAAVCNSGTCGLSCTSPTPNTCGPGCVNCTTSIAGATSTCNGAGGCTVTCTQSGHQLCGSACIDVTSNNSNCGGCNAGCNPGSTGEICVASACRAQFAVSVGSFAATQNVTFSGQVASFSDLLSTDSASSLTATVAWGDGGSSAGTIGGSNGSFTVSGSHTYGASGNYSVIVTVKATGSGATASGTATISVGSCTPGDTECSGDVQQSCQPGGTWGGAMTCPYLCIGKVCGGSCKPNALQCLAGSQTQYQTCSAGGSWNPPQTCPFACYQNQCTGTCVPGTYQCDPSTKNPDLCDATGHWASHATCNTPAQICQLSSGVASCVTNSPYNFPADNATGSSASGWRTYNPPLSYVIFEPITPTVTASVQDLALFAGAANGTARMYLYSDNGGQPGTFMASSGSIGIASGVDGAPPTPAATTVTGGTMYWLGAEFFTPSGAVSLYQKSVPGAFAYQYSHVAAGFGGAMPSTFGSSDVLVPITDLEFSFYLVLQTVP